MSGKYGYCCASHKSCVRKYLLQVCRCGKQLLPIRQIAFGHRDSRIDNVVHTGRINEVWTPVGFDPLHRVGWKRRREVASSHQAARERLRHLSLPASTQNDLGDGVTSGWIIAGTIGVFPSRVIIIAAHQESPCLDQAMLLDLLKPSPTVHIHSLQNNSPTAIG